MTEAYRTRELTKAEQEYTRARTDYDAAETRAAKVDADERMQFWGNKKANLASRPAEEA